MDFYTPEELRALGFQHVGKDVRVSRRAVFYDIAGEIGDGARIDDFAILTGTVLIGGKVHVSPFCFLGGTGGRISLGNGVGLSTHVSIFTKSDDYQAASEGPRPKVVGNVAIGEHTIFGAQCVVLPGVTIGKFCSVGAGCVINGDLPDSGRYISVGIKSVRLA